MGRRRRRGGGGREQPMKTIRWRLTKRFIFSNDCIFSYIKSVAKNVRFEPRCAANWRQMGRRGVIYIQASGAKGFGGEGCININMTKNRSAVLMSSFPDSQASSLRGKVDSPPSPFQEPPRWSLSVVLKYTAQPIGKWPAVQFTWLNCFCWSLTYRVCMVHFNIDMTVPFSRVFRFENPNPGKLAGWNIGTFPKIPQILANVPICWSDHSERIWKGVVELGSWFDEAFKSVLVCLCQFSCISAPPKGPEKTLSVLKKA